MSPFGRNGLTMDSQNRKQIICRLCERVLYSTQALITHIESHIVQGDIIGPNRRNNNPTAQPNNNNNTISFSIQPNPNYRPTNRPRDEPPSSVVLPLFSSQAERQVLCPIPVRPGPSLSLNLGGDMSSRSGARPALISGIFSLSRCVSTDENVVNRARLGKRQRESIEDVVSPIDGTRPFLSQLNRMIPTIVDLEMGNEEECDLTLKLGQPY